MYFYPRSPCGERLLKNHILFVHNLFLSTLSLRRATPMERGQVYYIRFLSTLSLRRATLRVVDGSKSSIISIHALLAESDCQWRRSVKLFRQFLSTLSLRRATINTYHRIFGEGISIHALLAESDPPAPPTARGLINFYPRSHWGERPVGGS